MISQDEGRINLLITGWQGSGKTTQAKIIAREYGLYYLATGDIFRRVALEDSERGRRFKEAQEKGIYAPNKDMADLVREVFISNEFHLARGYVSERYPASEAQIREFDPKINLVLWLKVPRSVCMARILSSQNRDRPDDILENIESRMHEFKTKTLPLIHRFQSEGLVIEVDGDQPEAAVTRTITEVLSRRGVFMN